MKLADNIKQDSKSFFKYMRQNQKVKDSMGPLKTSDGTVISDYVCMAEELNNYFTSVFTDENTRNIPEMASRFNESEVSNYSQYAISELDVFKKLSRLNPSSAWSR